VSDDDVAKVFNRVPLLSVWADHSSATRPQRRRAPQWLLRQRLPIAAKGGPAKFMLLPRLGIRVTAT
jgi:hypothetical protein